MEEIKFTGLLLENKEGTYVFEGPTCKKIKLQLGEKPKKYFSSLIPGNTYYLIYDSETNLINFVKKTDERKIAIPGEREEEPEPIVLSGSANRSEKENYFMRLTKVSCKVEKKGMFNYVSWANAWKEIKRLHPKAQIKVYENEQGFPAFIHPKFGGFVKVGVTVNGIEHIENYPITDNRNKTIFANDINVFVINTSIKRAMAKAIALHGIGLYVYEGEDLPDE